MFTKNFRLLIIQTLIFLMSVLLYSQPKEKSHFWDKHNYDSIAIESNTQSTTKDNFESIQKKYNGNDFNYDLSIKEYQNLWGRIKQKVYDFFRSFNVFSEIDITKQVFYLLIFIGSLTLLYLLYVLLFKGKGRFNNPNKESDESDWKFIEENLLDISLKSYIDEAVQNKDYALAIRYMHLSNLQQLAKKGLVTWDHKKTNGQITQEIEDKAIRKSFRRNTAIYNQIWFGKFQIQASDFDEHSEYFTQFNNQLSK